MDKYVTALTVVRLPEMEIGGVEPQDFVSNWGLRGM